MEILGKLFGSNTIVKILRLFLFNPDEGFEMSDVTFRTKAHADVVRAELSMLQSIGFVKQKTFYKDTPKKRSSMVSRRKVNGWTLNEAFPYLRELQNLLINSMLIKKEHLVGRIGKTGKIKLIVLSGIFLQDWDSRLDLLIVGDAVKYGKLERTMKDLESELGKELRYALFTADEFKYRMNMYDKLVRDIFEYPHDTILDRLQLAR